MLILKCLHWPNNSTKKNKHAALVANFSKKQNLACVFFLFFVVTNSLLGIPTSVTSGASAVGVSSIITVLTFPGFVLCRTFRGWNLHHPPTSQKNMRTKNTQAVTLSLLISRLISLFICAVRCYRYELWLIRWSGLKIRLSALNMLLFSATLLISSIYLHTAVISKSFFETEPLPPLEGKSSRFFQYLLATRFA